MKLTTMVTVAAIIEYNYIDDMKWSLPAAIFFAFRDVGGVSRSGSFACRDVGNMYRKYGSRAMHGAIAEEQLSRSGALQN